MKDKAKPRCTVLFEESIKSEYTKKNYCAHMKQFRAFAGLSSDEEILAVGQDGLQTVLEDYLMHLRQTANPNSVPSRFQGIRHFCVMNRIRLDWDIIRKMFPQRQKTQSLRAYTTQEVRQMLSSASSLRDAALVGFLASTGARIGALDHSLTVSHIKRMPCRCSAVRIYAGHLEEYWAFLTPQASGMLEKYHDHRMEQGETFSENTPVFAARNTASQLRWNGARTAIYRTV